MNVPHGPDQPRTHNGKRRRLYGNRQLRRNILHAARMATATPQNVQRDKQGIGPGRKMLRSTEPVMKARLIVERVQNTRPHRLDGTVATKPPIIRRKRHRRRRTEIARASRKANR